MHKLWPHSVQPRTPEQHSEVVNEDKKESEIKDEQEISDDKIDSNEDKNNSQINEKTPMCLIHELVKFNKV